jgi:hypothetical protein
LQLAAVVEGARQDRLRKNLSCVALLRPVPALIASISVRASTPAFTASTAASQAAAIPAAEIILLASLVICPRPGACPT